LRLTNASRLAAHANEPKKNIDELQEEPKTKRFTVNCVKADIDEELFDCLISFNALELGEP